MGILNRISVRQRITIGLVGMMVGSLLFASAFGFFPNEQEEILRGRAKFCESLAISGTAMASSGQMASLKATLESVVKRDDQHDDDVLSIGLRTEQDGLLIAAGAHEENWVAETDKNVHQMKVPVYRKGKQWGQLEVCFRGTGGLLGLNYWAPAWLLVLVVPACFIQFDFYLRKTLKQLNPSDSVPQNVEGAFNTLSVGLMLIESGRIVFVNNELSTSVGRPRDELQGAAISCLDWEVPDDCEDDLPWISAKKSSEPVYDRILHLTTDGRRRTYSVNCIAVGRGMMAIFDDITLLEEAREAALLASESKSAFLANMSHEIRTPLNAVLGFTDVLRRGLVTDTEESIGHLNMIHRSGKHLLELINDILDLSKIEAGKMDVEAIDTHVDQIVLDTVDVLGVRARENDLDLKVEFKTAIPRTIQSDPTRLKQIITNLIGNAIKFTEQGSVTIAAGMIDGDSRIKIDIIDTGIGMTPEQADKIFESFSQADETTTRKFGGTGLGLSISRRLAEALGGELTVTSEAGVGSTFSVTVPVDRASLADMISVDEMVSRREADITADANKKITRLPAKPVLVVDDGEANRRLIELVLGRAGAIVTSVENGLEAIKALAKQDYDLIFMDMQMPVLDGYAATRRIRSVGLETPVIALTGNAMKGDREKCMDAGCNDFLSKPVDIDKLLERAAHYLGTASEADTERTLADSSEPTARAAVLNDTTSGPETPVASAIGSRFDGKVTSAVPNPIQSTLPMDDEEFREIVVDFVQRLESRLDGISQSLAEADFEAVSSDAHWLKGAGGTVGFAEFTEPARSLEHAAKESDLDQATEILGTIQDIRSRLVVPEMGQSATTESGPSHNLPNLSTQQIASAEQPISSQPTSPVGPPIHCTLPLDDVEFCEIVSDFVARLDLRLEAMHRLCDDGQFSELAADAHWLKGSGGTVGYVEFAEPAAALEQAAKRESCVDARESLEAVMNVRRRLVVPQTPSEQT